MMKKLIEKLNKRLPLARNSEEYSDKVIAANRGKKYAFSLAETMVTLLITSVVITASIPVFTQQRHVQDTSDKSIWQRADNNADIYYCPQGNCNMGIGTISPQYKLHVIGDANDNQLYFRKSYSGPAYLQFLDSDGNPTGGLNYKDFRSYGYGYNHVGDSGNNQFISIGYLTGYGFASTYVGNHHEGYGASGTAIGVGYGAIHSGNGGRAIGYKAGYYSGISGIGAEIGTASLSIGYQAKYEGVNSENDTAIGAFAFRSPYPQSTDAHSSVAVGYSAAYNNTGFTSAIGYNAGYRGAWEQTYIGYQADCPGGDGIGYQAGYPNNQGIAIGYQALTNSASAPSWAVGYQAGRNNSVGYRYYIANSSTATPLVYGAGSANPTMTVNGDLILPQSYSVSSDRRLKNIIGDYDDGLESVLNFKPKRFFFKKHEKFAFDTKKEQIGLIAQEVKKEIPYAVSKGNHDYYTLSYAQIRYALIDAIQELVQNNELLEAKQSKLKKRNLKLKQRLNELKEQVAEIKAEYNKIEQLEKEQLSLSDKQAPVIADQVHNDNHDYLKISYGDIYAGM